MTKNKQNQTLNNWQKVTLAEATTYINRGVPPIYTQDNAGTAVINQKCIRDGQVNFEFARLTDESARQIPQDKLVKPYDILVNSTGTGTVGRVGQIINLTQRATADGHVTIVRPKKEEVDPIYLGIWLKSQQNKLEDLAEGSSNQVELSRDKIASIKVLLPPLKTQQKIADILYSLNEAIQGTDQITRKTQKLKKGLMNELLTKGIGHKKFKKTKLGEIPEEWEIVEMNKITKNITDGKHGDCSNEANSGYYFVSVKDIRAGQIDYTNARQITKKDFEETHKRTKLEVGDLLLTNSGTIGRMAVVPDKEITTRTTFQKSVAIIKPDSSKVNVYYMMYALTMVLKSLITASSGSAQANLLLRDLRSYKIPLPSLEEQQKIAGILAELDTKLDQESKQKASLIKLKNGLMQDIFSQKVQI